MEVFKNNVSLEATPTGDTHVTNKAYVDSKQITISWADYQALSEDEKNNGTTYYIPDMPTSAIDEEYIYKHYQGEEVLCVKLSDVGTHSNWTKIPTLTIPSIDGYEIVHVSPYISNMYVVGTCCIMDSTIQGFGFSMANGNQYARYCAYVIYKKL